MPIVLYGNRQEPNNLFEEFGYIDFERPCYPVERGQTHAVLATFNSLEPSPFKSQAHHVFLGQAFSLANAADIPRYSSHEASSIVHQVLS